MDAPVKVRCVQDAEPNHLIEEAQRLGAQIISQEGK